jgi:hypothetical protein
LLSGWGWAIPIKSARPFFGHTATIVAETVTHSEFKTYRLKL